MFQGLPRWLIAFGIVVIAVIEITSRLPDIMLLPQKLRGGAGEYDAKALQPQLTEATIAKTDAEARAAAAQAQLNTVQQAKVEADTKVAQLQQQVTQLQGILFAAQASQAQSQARLADTQAAKTTAETQVVQLQRSLTVAQTGQANAQASQAQAQATQTNLQTAGAVVAWAAIIGGGIYAADKLGYIPHDQGTTQASTQTTTQTTAAAQPTQDTSSPFEVGRSDWHRWHDWTAGLSGDHLAGEAFWAGNRSQHPARGCAAAPGSHSAEFMEGCEAAKKFLAGVDQSRNNTDYKAGWNQGAKETGDN
jgi:hypothetical protein